MRTKCALSCRHFLKPEVNHSHSSMTLCLQLHCVPPTESIVSRYHGAKYRSGSLKGSGNFLEKDDPTFTTDSDEVLGRPTKSRINHDSTFLIWLVQPSDDSLVLQVPEMYTLKIDLYMSTSYWNETHVGRKCSDGQKFAVVRQIYSHNRMPFFQTCVHQKFHRIFSEKS